MEESEFRGFLEVFPVVRSRNYRAESELTGESSSRSQQNEFNEWKDAWDGMDAKECETEDPFWQKLRLKAEKKVGPVEAEKFCEAFQRVYKRLVHEGVSLDAARKFVGTTGSSTG